MKIILSVYNFKCSPVIASLYFLYLELILYLYICFILYNVFKANHSIFVKS